MLATRGGGLGGGGGFVGGGHLKNIFRTYQKDFPDISHFFLNIKKIFRIYQNIFRIYDKLKFSKVPFGQKMQS